MANEKRLIDSDRLIRSLKAMTSEYDAVSLHGIINSLKEWPTLDAVEVVRCKDCVFCKLYSESGEYHCRTMKGMYRAVKPNDFCSYGERNENG